MYNPKHSWLFNIPLVGIIYLIILGFRKGWDTEMDEYDSSNSAYQGISSAIVILVILLSLL